VVNRAVFAENFPLAWILRSLRRSEGADFDAVWPLRASAGRARSSGLRQNRVWPTRVTTSGRCRNSWGIVMYPLRWSTRMWWTRALAEWGAHWIWC